MRAARFLPLPLCLSAAARQFPPNWPPSELLRSETAGWSRRICRVQYEIGSVSSIVEPGLVSNRMRFAAHYFAAGEAAEMERVISETLANPERYPNGHIEAGDLYPCLGEFDRAVSVYQAGVTQFPGRARDFELRVAKVGLARGRSVDAVPVPRRRNAPRPCPPCRAQ